MTTTSYRKGTLEAKLDELLPEWPAFDVIYHELWRESEGGWSVNDSWKAQRGVDRETAISALRGRWEIFKLNYLPKATVKDIENAAWEGDEALLEVHCTAFANVRKSEA